MSTTTAAPTPRWRVRGGTTTPVEVQQRLSLDVGHVALATTGALAGAALYASITTTSTTTVAAALIALVLSAAVAAARWPRWSLWLPTIPEQIPADDPREQPATTALAAVAGERPDLDGWREVPRDHDDLLGLTWRHRLSGSTVPAQRRRTGV